MKPIFVTQRLTAIKEYSEERECLDIRWAAFLKECGLLPIVLPINGDIEQYFQHVKPVGLLLTGGNNLESCQPHDTLNKKRDLFEAKLINRANHDKKPLLGICRGMQMIAWYFGSTLVPIENHVTVSHSVTVQSDSIFYPFYKDEPFVNSYHEFRVLEENEKFKARVRSCSDQTIEGMSSVDGKIAGIMWHPERVSPFSDRDVAFLNSFLMSINLP